MSREQKEDTEDSMQANQVTYPSKCGECGAVCQWFATGVPGRAAPLTRYACSANPKHNIFAVASTEATLAGLNNYPERKEIAQRAQAEYDRRTEPKRISVKVGYRVYTFATGCRCGHLHLIADGGATLNACGGDCSAHFYESRTA